MTIGIIGVGRFGLLWAQLCASFCDVLVYDQKQEGLVLPDNVKKVSSLKEVCQQDILFLCVPISVLREVCTSVKPFISQETIVCDVSSVKVFPKQWMQEVFGLEQPLVFTHPLFGPDSVLRTGVEGKKIIIASESDDVAKQGVVSLCQNIGLKIIETSTDDHDMQMARSQALVHFIGRGLSPLELKSQEIATPDYERLLAMVDLVSHDTLELFFDMQRYNPYTKDVRDKFLSECSSLENKINID